MEIIYKIKDLFISPRFIAFYWLVGITTAIDLLGLLSSGIPDLGLPQWIAILVVGGISQITKALNNLEKGKAMGFAPKK